MFHIKVTCQKSFALTRMNSQRTATFFLNLPCCFFSAFARFEFGRLVPRPSSPSLAPRHTLFSFPHRLLLLLRPFTSHFWLCALD